MGLKLLKHTEATYSNLADYKLNSTDSARELLLLFLRRGARAKTNLNPAAGKHIFTFLQIPFGTNTTDERLIC